MAAGEGVGAEAAQQADGAAAEIDDAAGGGGAAEMKRAAHVGIAGGDTACRPDRDDVVPRETGQIGARVGGHAVASANDPSARGTRLRRHANGDAAFRTDRVAMQMRAGRRPAAADRRCDRATRSRRAACSRPPRTASRTARRARHAHVTDRHLHAGLDLRARAASPRSACRRRWRARQKNDVAFEALAHSVGRQRS